ncbi:DUF3408 domain-containing protein [Dysgonomonas sp. ZJ279]|uniref:DUF3408 domain-containing protein n=1 Tax=Dysgonomonas sp. ZJ279 TaxID=2709796 RepID=UPI0013EDF83C|nr:DUF3408 domain-containing protein [Dysgonomonas sp. ZJ279]
MKPKKITREEYAKRFCSEKRIRDRKVLYVNAETHRKIRHIALLFRDDYVTVMSLVDAILLHHIEQYKELIIELSQKDEKEFKEWWQSEVQQEEYEDDAPDVENESEPTSSF